MGQIPNNNIIKAQAGATLSLKVNGILKKVPVEKADEMAADEADRLISVGELRPSEKVAYMSSWNTLRDKMTSGEYDINTAGKNTVSGIKYTGPENTFGLQKGKNGELEASERGKFGDNFSKKTRRDRPSDVEAVVTRTMFPKIGAWTLDDDEITAAKAKTDEEALKLKQETDATNAKAAHKMYGVTPETISTKTPEQIAEETKQKQINLNEHIMQWNADIANPNMHRVDENTVESKVDNPKIFSNNPDFIFRQGRVKNAEGTLDDVYIGHPSMSQKGKHDPGDYPVYKKQIDKLTSKEVWVNTKNPKDIVRNEDFTDLTGDAAEADRRFSYDSHKKGGIIRAENGWASAPINKNLGKGTTVPNQGSTLDTKKEEIPTNTNKDTETKLSDIGGRWSASDDLELASLAADIGGLAASFVPGGSTVSGVAGLTGTGLAMAAEKSRGELGWEDTGKYALSGLLDLASVVPGLGIAAKVGKLNKSAAKTANIIFKASKAGLLGVGAGMTGVALTNVANKLSKDGFNSLTVQDLKTLTQGLTLLGHTAKSFAAPKAVELKPFSGEKTMGKAVDKVSGVELNKPITKDKDNNWVFEDQALNKDFNVGKSNPFLRKSEVIGAEDKIVNVPYLNKAKFNPATGKEKSFLERNSPLSKMTNKYIKNAGGPEKIIEPTKPVEMPKPVEVAKPVEVVKPVEAPVEVKKETPLVTAAQEAVNKKATMLAEANKERLAKIVENAKKEKDIEKEVLSAKPKPKAKGAAGVRAREAVRESSLSTTPRRSAKVVAKKLNGGLILKAQAGDVIGKPTNWLSTIASPALSKWGLKVDKPLTLLGTNTLSNAKATSLFPGKVGIIPYQPGISRYATADVDVAHDKNSTLWDRLKKINPNDKQSLALSEFGRTMFLNKALSEKQNPLYIPIVNDKAETRIGVTGDLLTKGAYYGRANQMMSSANAFKTSDSTANFVRNLAASDQANQLRGQGDLADAQALQKNREVQAQGDEMNSQARKQNADQRSMYFNKALAAKNEADWDIKAQKASNLNTLWASQNLAKKQEMTERQSGLKNIALARAQAKLEGQYPGIVRNYFPLTGGTNPAYKADYDKYSNDLLDQQESIMYNKSGGELSTKYKHDTEMSKRENAFRKDITSVINKWTEKQGSKNYSGAIRTSKELNDLVSKIFSK